MNAMVDFDLFDGIRRSFSSVKQLYMALEQLVDKFDQKIGKVVDPANHIKLSTDFCSKRSKIYWLYDFFSSKIWVIDPEKGL